MIEINMMLVLTSIMIAVALIFSHVACYHHGKYKAYTHASKIMEEMVNKVKQLFKQEKENDKESESLHIGGTGRSDGFY